VFAETNFRLRRHPTGIGGKCGDHFLQADFRVLIRTFSGRTLAQVWEGVVQLASTPAKQEAANEKPNACLVSRRPALIEIVSSNQGIANASFPCQSDSIASAFASLSRRVLHARRAAPIGMHLFTVHAH
jgi:hypothetical protein